MAAASLIERIAGVDPAHAETIRSNPTTFAVEELPFYPRFRLVRAEVRLRSRPLLLRYADDGKAIVPLTGKPEEIYGLNRAEGLKLALPWVASYARFFLSCTGGPKFTLRESAEGIRWLPAADSDPVQAERKRQVLEKLSPLTAFAVDTGGFAVTAVAQRDRSLVELVLRFTEDGEATSQQETMVVPVMPVPYVA